MNGEITERGVPADFDIVRDTIQTWLDGGWVMIPLVLLAIFIYYQATALVFHLGKARLRKVSQSTWSKWIDDPEKGEGHLGEVIRFIMSGEMIADKVRDRVAIVKQNLIPDVNQRVVVLSVVITVAPLMGLLGTVIGMLTTFRGLGISGAHAIDIVADGIRVALITTQTGLMIAIPGYLFIAAILKRRNEYLAFLAHVENKAIQKCSQLSKSRANGKEPADETSQNNP